MKNNDMIRPCESSTKPEGKIVNEEVDPWDAFMHLKSTRKNMKTLLNIHRHSQNPINITSSYYAQRSN